MSHADRTLGQGWGSDLRERESLKSGRSAVRPPPLTPSQLATGGRVTRPNVLLLRDLPSALVAVSARSRPGDRCRLVHVGSTIVELIL